MREAIAAWARRRYQLTALDALTQVLPVNGSREALFALAQTVIDPGRGDALVICPNPFYQIYEGAALLAGASPYYVNALPEQGFNVDYAGVPEEVLARTQLVYACSPGNPTGKVMDLAQWRVLFDLSDRHGFVIASDECYSEIYLDEGRPPLGALDAAQQLGRKDYARLIVFSSLSKRSNVPGMRTGFVAGDRRPDPRIPALPHLPRQRHGPAGAGGQRGGLGRRSACRRKPPPVRARNSAPRAAAAGAADTQLPDGGFYLWSRSPGGVDTSPPCSNRQHTLNVLPGSYLARDVERHDNPCSTTSASRWWRHWPSAARWCGASTNRKSFRLSHSAHERDGYLDAAQGEDAVWR